MTSVSILTPSLEHFPGALTRSIRASSGLRPYGNRDPFREWNGSPTDDFYLRQLAQMFFEHAGAVELQIELDAVTFNDGTLVGPDKSKLGDHLGAYLAAKRDLYRKIGELLDEGRSADEASAHWMRPSLKGAALIYRTHIASTAKTRIAIGDRTRKSQ